MQRVVISFGLALLSLLASYAVVTRWPDTQAANSPAQTPTPVVVGHAN